MQVPYLLILMGQLLWILTWVTGFSPSTATLYPGDLSPGTQLDFLIHLWLQKKKNKIYKLISFTTLITQDKSLEVHVMYYYELSEYPEEGIQDLQIIKCSNNSVVHVLTNSKNLLPKESLIIHIKSII